MKKGYPNPTFLQKAEGIKDKRKKRTLTILVSVSAIVLILVFIISVASKQFLYRERFPDLVGKATEITTTTEHTVRTHATTTESTTEETTTEETTETTPLAPIIATSSTSETSEESSSSSNTTQTVNLNPEQFTEINNIHFKSTYPAQTISHQQRAINLDALKSKVESFQKEHKDMRICFQYVSLKSNESIGVDELDPIVPASAFNLPVLTLFYEDVAKGNPRMDNVYAFTNDRNKGNSSYIAQNFSSGKQFYLRSLAFYTASYNDNVALSCIEESLGGKDNLRERINNISSYQNYWEKTIYTDYSGKEYKALSLSSCYDMTKYAQYLYNGYINKPEIYQRLINDLSQSKVNSPLAEAFGDDSTVFHIYGRNQVLGAFTEVAIIDGLEPIAVCIYVECKNQNIADSSIKELSQYMAQFISSCYS